MCNKLLLVYYLFTNNYLQFILHFIIFHNILINIQLEKQLQNNDSSIIPCYFIFDRVLKNLFEYNYLQFYLSIKYNINIWKQ